MSEIKTPPVQGSAHEGSGDGRAGRSRRSSGGRRDKNAHLAQRLAVDNGWTFSLTDKETQALQAVVRAGYLSLTRWSFRGMKIEPVHVKTIGDLYRNWRRRAWDALPEEERVMRLLSGERPPKP